MRRELLWVKTNDFQGWACSQCAWAFRTSEPPMGNTLEEMKENYERQRDREFVSHACAANPRNKNPKMK
jgi:hypothetical protein